MTRRATKQASRETRLVAYAATRFGARAGSVVERAIRKHGMRSAIHFVVGFFAAEDRAAALAELRRDYFKSAELYEDLRAEAVDLLAELGHKLGAHAERQARDPKKFGFAGDLAGKNSRRTSRSACACTTTRSCETMSRTRT